MSDKRPKSGRALEQRVAQAYRDMRARRVEHDVELAGHQIDVYAEMETSDRSVHRLAIEAKDYSRPVGIDIVRRFSHVVDGLRRLRLVDEGIIVSAAGFSRQARNAAAEEGIRLQQPADLDAMVAAAGAAALESGIGAAVEHQLSLCRERDVRLRSPHVVAALLGPQPTFASVCFDSVSSGYAQRLTNMIDTYIARQDEREGESGFVELQLHQQPVVRSALELAVQEGAAQADERHLLLAFLDSNSALRGRILRDLGDERFALLRRTAASNRPGSAFVGATPVSLFDEPEPR